MKRFGYAFVLAALVIVLSLQISPAQATRVISAWSQIYEGIQYATGTDDTPRLMKAFAFKIDLDNPYVQLYCSHDNGANPYEVALQTTPAFLADHGCKVAVNTCYFNPSLSPNTDIEGLLISNGTLVSSWQTERQSELLVTADNVASIVYAGGDPPPGTYYTACSGDAYFLSNGVPQGDNVTCHPRTGCGLSQDGRYLILAVVDGRQEGWSMGASIYEMGQWMADFGSYNAFNLDGGGSTTMVREDIGIVNSPAYGYARSVGASIGVIVNTPAPPEVVIDNPAGVPTGSWATGTSSADKYGTDYRYHSTSTSSTDIFTWTPSIPTAGNWTVYAWWPQGANRSAAAPYTIYYSGGSAAVNCNQQSGGGQWNSLGTYNFAAGTGGYVTLGCIAPTGFNVMADAVRFVKCPDAPASAAVGAVTTSSIVWNWGDVSLETGYRVYAAATGGSPLGSTSAGVLTWNETGRAANTSYTRYVCAYSSVGESLRTQLPTTVTLSVAPTTSTVTCDKPTNTTQTTPAFTFTAVGGFGAGKVQYYKYAWDQSATHTWTGSEATWNSGTLARTATADGNWYLHIKGYNSANVANGTLDMGPYVYVAPADVIVDNPAGVPTGTWSTGTSSTDKYGTDYRFHSTSATSTDKFTWTPNLPSAGTYKVYAWWPQGGNRSTAAPYTIYYNGGSASVPCNQQGGGGTWNLLGTYNFAAGTGGYVTLGVIAPTGFTVMADAVRFVKP